MERMVELNGVKVTKDQLEKALKAFDIETYEPKPGDRVQFKTGHGREPRGFVVTKDYVEYKGYKRQPHEVPLIGLNTGSLYSPSAEYIIKIGWGDLD